MTDTDALSVEVEMERDEAPGHVVAIGASAVGLEPIDQLFDRLPTRTGAAFVLIQHLSPDFESLMDQLLARHTAMAIEAAPGLVSPVFRDLVGNAVEHHHRAAGVITVRGERENGRAEFFVSEDGRGIDRAMHEQIFEPFRKIAPPARRHRHGPGLPQARPRARPRRHRDHRLGAGSGHDLSGHAAGAARGGLSRAGSSPRRRARRATRGRRRRPRPSRYSRRR